MEKAAKELSLDELKSKSNLSLDDMAAVEREVQEELYETPQDEPEKKKPNEDEDEAPKDDKEAAEKKEKPEDEEPAEKPEAETEEQKADKQKKLLEEALKKPEDKRSAEEIAAIDAHKKAEKEAQDKRVKDLAAEQKISEEDARKEIESYSRIAEKYKRDPEQMAKALLRSQREFQKLRDQNQEAQNRQIEQSLEIKEGDELSISGKKLSWEEAKPQIVETMRKREPELTEDMDDDQVVRVALREINKQRKLAYEDQKVKITEDARAKREEIISGLDVDEKFIPEIKSFLDEAPDRVVLDNRFDIQEAVMWAKGKHYDSDLKAHGEREYKRGLEDRKILGEKGGAGPVGGGKSKSNDGESKKGWNSLSESAKTRAREMYESAGFTEQEMYEAYMDYVESEKPDDKKKK